MAEPTKPQKENSPFQQRQQWRVLKHWGSWAHVFSLITLVLICLSLLPGGHVGWQTQVFLEKERVAERQLVLEALDKLVRYEHYYREMHGRFTRDLEHLGYPERLSHGDFSQIRANYEISVLEAGADHLLVTATGAGDRASMDDRHRLQANFILPPPNKFYLLEEADRMLQLYSKGEGRVDGLYSNYWKLDSHIESQGEIWIASGLKSPVQGERRELASLKEAGARNVASIFSGVSEKLRGRIEEEARDPAAKTEPQHAWNAADVKRWLQQVRQAQYVYRREKGAFASSWEQLGQVSKLVNPAAAKEQLHLGAWELGDNSYRVTVEGVRGELLGEKFVLSDGGQVKQIRYTQSLIQSLEQATSALPGGRNNFEITELTPDAPPLLDSQKRKPVELKNGSGSGSQK